MSTSSRASSRASSSSTKGESNSDGQASSKDLQRNSSEEHLRLEVDSASDSPSEHRVRPGTDSPSEDEASGMGSASGGMSPRSPGENVSEVGSANDSAGGLPHEDETAISDNDSAGGLPREDETDGPPGLDSSEDETDGPTGLGSESDSKQPSSTSGSSSSERSSTDDSNMSVEASKLDLELVETKQDHMSRHPCPADTQTSCARCKYIVYGEKFRKGCYFVHPVTKERISWLIEQPDAHNKPWGLGCFLCRMAGKKSKMARCEFGTTVNSLTFQNIRRHGNTETSRHVLGHEEALQEWTQKNAGQGVSNLSLIHI